MFSSPDPLKPSVLPVFLKNFLSCSSQPEYKPLLDLELLLWDQIHSAWQVEWSRVNRLSVVGNVCSWMTKTLQEREVLMAICAPSINYTFKIMGAWQYIMAIRSSYESLWCYDQKIQLLYTVLLIPTPDLQLVEIEGYYHSCFQERVLTQNHGFHLVFLLLSFWWLSASLITLKGLSPAWQ